MPSPMMHLAEMAGFGYDCYTAKGADLGRSEGGVYAACNVENGIWVSDYKSRS